MSAPEPTRHLTALAELLSGYSAGLAVERALSPGTVRDYMQLADQFLSERVTIEDQLGVEGLTGGDVTGFLLRESARLRPSSVRCGANRMRQLLRYLAMRGFADPGLAEAVPSVGLWRDGSGHDRPASALLRRRTTRTA